MKLLLVLFFLSTQAFAINCDCEVKVMSPMTGSHQMHPNVLKRFELEEFGRNTVKSQNLCRKSCAETYEKEMPSDRLHALLLVYSQELITNKAVGYNCTGLTTLKYPVRVKAYLGEMSLGNIADTVQVITHEELCF